MLGLVRSRCGWDGLAGVNERATYDDCRDRAIVSVMFAEPMYSVGSLFDFEDFCIRCATDLPAILRLVDWAQERCVANMKLLCTACQGMDIVLVHSGIK